MAFIDTSTLRRSQLAKENRPILYGRQIMFASLGLIFGIFVSNLSVDFFPNNDKISCYAGIFVTYGIYTVLYGVFTIISYRGLLFQEVKEKRDNKETSFGQTTQKEQGAEEDVFVKSNKRSYGRESNKLNDMDYSKVFIKTIFQFYFLFFYLTTFISGVEYLQSISFLFVYLKELGASSSLLTLSIIQTGIALTLCYPYSHKIINLLGGKWRTIIFTFIMYFVRYLGMSLIGDPWLVLIFQPIHGITTGLYLVAALFHLKETSPLAVVTSLVSLFNATYYGSGTVIGSSISGVIYLRYGGRALFRYTALLSIGWTFVLIFYRLFQREERKKKKK